MALIEHGQRRAKVDLDAGSPAVFAGSLRSINPCLDALTDQLTLHLCDGSDHREDHPPHRSAGVDGLSGRDEVDAQGAKLIERIDQMPG